jgi:hypothetical protein
LFSDLFELEFEILGLCGGVRRQTAQWIGFHPRLQLCRAQIGLQT